MKRILNLLCISIVSATLFYSCINDLDTEPKVELSLEELLASDPNAVEGILAKLYASFALTSATGPRDADIEASDPGESGFLRNIINVQDFTADAMKNRWGDNGLDPLTTSSNWDGNNKFFRLLYDRSYFTIPQCNNLISILNNNTFENSEIVLSETRLLRALAYFYVIDVFGKGVLATEDNLGQSEPLPEASRQELFEFVESELLEIEPLLPPVIGYGRVNKFVASMLLAKLYLNAEVYTGIPRWDDAAIYVNKIINEGGYSLEPNFIQNFSGDNENSTEILFPLLADPLTNQSYGNTTYIVNGSMNSDTMLTEQFGNPGGIFAWAGHRATKAWYGLFGANASELAASNDIRASLFWTSGHSYEMTDYREWTNGYPSTKFRNSGALTNIPATEFSGTDFPLYRLADVYLMYAELAIRGAAGTSMNDALGYVNEVRGRSNADLISMGDLTEDFIIDERGRELNLEGHRRTDLIRFNRFTGGNYLWPWKGGVSEGTSIPNHYNVFPIPLSAINANSNLTQNPGY
jgi:hypothetical protein